MRQLVLLMIAIVLCNNVSAQCALASQASAGNCAGTPLTTALRNDAITGNTTFTYIKDIQHYDKYTVEDGATLVICDGGKLDVNTLTIKNASLYVSVGGSITIGNFKAQTMTFTNYGTTTCASDLHVNSDHQLYNAGIVYLGGLIIQNSSARITNDVAGIVSFTGHDLTINNATLVNNGQIIDINDFRNNSGTICMGNGSVMECTDFTNNSTNSVIVTSGTAGLIVNEDATNNQQLTNTANTLNVAIGNGCGNGPNNGNWGTADTFCNTTELPAFPVSASVFYTKSTGNLNDLTTWGDEPDGSGNNPADFTSDEKVYIVTNRSTANVNATWTVSGKGTILAIGDNTDAVNFNITGADVHFNGAAAVIAANSLVNIGPARTVAFGPTSSLWITSIAEGDGAIGRVDGSILGLNDSNIVMNKYIPAFATRKWSFLASPLNSGLLSFNWQQQIHITGPLGTGGVLCTDADSTSFSTANSSDGLDPNQTGNYSMYYFDETVAPNTTGQWKPVSNTINSNADFQLTRGNGFRVLVRGRRELGCYLIGPNPTPLGRLAVTLRSFGSFSNILNGTSLSVPYSTANGNVFVMLGNPFIGTLDFADFQADASNSSILNAKYWLYSPEFASGVYSTYASGVLTNRPSNYAGDGSEDHLLGSWQAFIVELASAGSGSFTFEQSHKHISTPFTGSFKTTATAIPDLLYIGFQTATGNKLDEAAIRFVNDPGVTNTNYSGYDAISLSGEAGWFLQTVKDTFKMSVQARMPLVTSDTVALNISSITGGNFQLTANGISSFTNTDIYLLDRFTTATHKLNDDPDYSFMIDVSNTATLGPNRFAVIFEKHPDVVMDRGASAYKAYPSPVKDVLKLELPGSNGEYKISMINVTGSAVYSVTMREGLNFIDMKTFSAGTYLLKITDDKGNAELLKIVKL